jgi:RimJ/RimL family protein N-acetyltransferase
VCSKLIPESMSKLFQAFKSFSERFTDPPGRYGTPLNIPRKRLPPSVIRPYRPDDHGECIEIYRENEIDRFPVDDEQHFHEHLLGNGCLKLVLEHEGTIVGTAGLSIMTSPTSECAWLSYGLVSPRLHGQGFGTTLALARLALLPVDRPHWFIWAQSVRRSQSFYQQLGFRHSHVIATDPEPISGYIYIEISRFEIRGAREHLRKSLVVSDISGETIPRLTVSDATSGKLDE